MRVEVVDDSEIPATKAGGKLAAYVEALKRLAPGKALQITPEEGETKRALKRRFTAVQDEAGVRVTMVDDQTGFYIVMRPAARKTRAKRGSASAAGRR